MKIFLAAPFTFYFQKRSGLIQSAFRKKLQTIIENLSKMGHQVISAHLRENWGKNLMAPSEFTPLDIDAIKNCDVVIAYVDLKPSGVYIELGWASALGKKTIIITETPISQLSPLLIGLSMMNKATVIEFKDIEDLLNKLRAYL